MRTFLLVIDSFGIGAMPDAEAYGDVGADTYGNICRATGIILPNLVSLGLNNIEGVGSNLDGRSLCPVDSPLAAHARLSEKTPAKDTTAGHYEIAGLVLERPFRVYSKFPPDVMRDLEAATGMRFLGNEAASGTEIIRRLGDEHCRTGKPILYTSQDSVLQIAADTSVIPLERLYAVCEAARQVMTGDRAVGRVIARPFIRKDGAYIRTEDRKDYALEPPGRTLLDDLTDHAVPVTAVGKIRDIFCGRGISESVHTGNNLEGLAALQDLVASDRDGLVFVNLVDTDMLYGHRNDVQGYAEALRTIDGNIPLLMQNLRGDDVLIITADHGCDPTTPSTDHSREYTPLLIYGNEVAPLDLKTIRGFDCIADYIRALYGIGADPLIYDKIMRGSKSC